jgi:hypothetical protein
MTKLNPKNLVRQLKEMNISNFSGKTVKNPNRTITCIVRKYASQVGDCDLVENFSSNGSWPEEHRERAIDIISDLAEYEGYDRLDVVWS